MLSFPRERSFTGEGFWARGYFSQASLVASFSMGRFPTALAIAPLLGPTVVGFLTVLFGECLNESRGSGLGDQGIMRTRLPNWKPFS